MAASLSSENGSTPIIKQATGDEGMKNAPQRKNIALGSEMEARACAFLEAQGLVTVRRNFRCRVGEIDLVMNDGSTLVFVEVRYRVSKAYGGAGASITFAKQQKVR